MLRPQTGEIKAMVGGRNYAKSQFNRIFQAKRQPGSIFKPFVYLAALMHGGQSGTRYNPDTLVSDTKFTWNYEGQEWQPNNYNDEYFGTVTMTARFGDVAESATGRLPAMLASNGVR